MARRTRRFALISFSRHQVAIAPPAVCARAGPDRYARCPLRQLNHQMLPSRRENKQLSCPFQRLATDGANGAPRRAERTLHRDGGEILAYHQRNRRNAVLRSCSRASREAQPLLAVFVRSRSAAPDRAGCELVLQSPVSLSARNLEIGSIPAHRQVCKCEME